MLIEEKYFYQDKNHLLKTVQAFSKDTLLGLWLQEILAAYNLQHNPMGLEDDFIFEIKHKIFAAKELLEEPYDTLAAIYRFNYGDNQLTFQWDGRTHMEVYDSDWKTMYSYWAKQLSIIKEIQRPILRYAVSDQQTGTGFLTQSIKRGILSFFNVRLRAKTLYRISA
ncbi:MAG: hypothetical protein AAF620_18045 [Bacteroidota bacterium]